MCVVMVLAAGVRLACLHHDTGEQKAVLGRR
jgi:hypothetical protein